AVHHDRRASRRSQSHVENGAVFRHVDLVTPEHRVDAFPEAAFLGQPTRQRDGLVGDAILRIVEVDPDGLRGQTFPTRRIGGEERAEVAIRHLVAMYLESFPRLPRRQWQGCCHHWSLMLVQRDACGALASTDETRRRTRT